MSHKPPISWLLTKLGFVILILAISPIGLIYHFAVRREFANSFGVQWQDLVPHYPHVLFYPAIVGIPLGLAVAASVIGRFRQYSRAQMLVLIFLPLLAVAVGLVFVQADASSGKLMLVEFAPQEVNKERFEHVDSVLNLNPSNEAVDLSPEETFLKSMELFALSENLQLAESRWLYLATLFSIAFLVIVSLYLAASLPFSKALPTNCDIIATILAALMVALWLPFRFAFNEETKFKLFGDDTIISGLPLGKEEVSVIVLTAMLLLPIAYVIWKRLLNKKVKAHVVKVAAGSSAVSIVAFVGALVALCKVITEHSSLSGPETHWYFMFCTLLVVSGISFLIALTASEQEHQPR